MTASNDMIEVQRILRYRGKREAIEDCLKHSISGTRYLAGYEITETFRSPSTLYLPLTRAIMVKGDLYS